MRLHSTRGGIWIAIAGVILVAVVTASEPSGRRIQAIDIARVGELYRVVDGLGDSLWPGFDIRAIPIAINSDDTQELVIAADSLSEPFRPYEGPSPIEGTIFIRDGCTHYGPRGGGWAAEVAGRTCAYVSNLQDDQLTDDYLSLLLHECFHVFQRHSHERADNATGELPELDADYSALIVLESRILHRAVQEEDLAEVRRLAELFVAVRQERRRYLPREVVLEENEQEFDEGTALYTEARLHQLLAREGGTRGDWASHDSAYHAFADAGAKYDELVERVLPPESSLVTFFHAKYRHGMAQCLLLDRLVPDWKQEMSAKGSTQFLLLERAFPLYDKRRSLLVTSAKREFGYGEIFSLQKNLVDDRVKLLCDYIEAPGRRYRVQFIRCTMPFKWKPRGPVYRVPTPLMNEIDKRLAIEPYDNTIGRSNMGPTLWTNGLEKFEVEEMDFRSDSIPVLLRLGFFEFIDPDPTAGGSALVIKSGSRDGDIYTDAIVSTDLFTLAAPRIRILETDEVVTLVPLPPE